MAAPNAEQVARTFRSLMFAILLVLVMNAAAIYINVSELKQNMTVLLGFLIANLAVTVLVIMQVVRVTQALGWSTVVTVLCALAMFAPCISLIVLLIINQAAVKILKAAGYKVGLMGAKM